MFVCRFHRLILYACLVNETQAQIISHCCVILETKMGTSNMHSMQQFEDMVISPYTSKLCFYILKYVYLLSPVKHILSVPSMLIET